MRDIVQKHGRWIALIILVAVTAFGLEEMSSDWQLAFSAWRRRLVFVFVGVGFAVLDVMFDVVLWMVVGRQFGLRLVSGRGVTIFLSMYAGVLLPAQLGRLIRPSAIEQHGLGDGKDAVKAEAVGFYFSAVASVATLCGLGTWALAPQVGIEGALAFVLSILAFVAPTVVLLFIADRLPKLSFLQAFAVPNYWVRPMAFALVVLAALSWIFHGLTLYAILHGLPGATVVAALLSGPISSLVGASTGLPGGIGAVETALGVSLAGLTSIASVHLPVAVAVFRLITLWAWLPIGWVAYGIVRPRLGEGLSARSRTDGDAPSE